jgi:hypothetical protein
LAYFDGFERFARSSVLITSAVTNYYQVQAELRYLVENKCTMPISMDVLRQFSDTYFEVSEFYTVSGISAGHSDRAVS